MQAVAACELLRRLKNVSRVIIVATASLKAEWEEQITKFINLPINIIQGDRGQRLKQYQQSAFFYIVNYEQVVRDAEDINRIIQPDIIILDEAQRIKNWQTKTAAQVKKLNSPYLFVLTGTPLENRIDDIYSIVQYVDPKIFGSLFRFNRDFYQFDDAGKPIGYKNLDVLHQRLRPVLLRRIKSDIEDELPERVVNHYFVKMHPEQITRYDEYKGYIARLLRQAKRRPLRKEDFEKIQRWLACMRMLCDTPYILDQDCRICPKLSELEIILEELVADPDTKIIIFSEWERMLQLVRGLAQKMSLSAAWHTGSVPQHKRREEINRFKKDPHCRLFLSTDSGSVGLNLQAANVVINLDLPWNPAKLEQRIARSWRKNQTRLVRVINLVTQNSIEHRMLDLLKQKQLMASGVLFGDENLKEMLLPSGRSAFISKMEDLFGETLDTDVSKQSNVENNSQINTQYTSQSILTQLSNRLDLLVSYKKPSVDQAVLLAVANDEKTTQQLQKIINDNTENVVLEILDQNTFETLQRLAKLGIIQMNADLEFLHRSPKITPQHTDKQLQFIKQAKIHVQQAERNLRMSHVLIEGDFCEEALTPLRASVQSLINAVSVLKNGKQVSVETLPAYIQSQGFKSELVAAALELLTVEQPERNKIHEWYRAMQELRQTVEKLESF